jgi:hypothetical protein
VPTICAKSGTPIRREETVDDASALTDLDVGSWQLSDFEQMGSKEKFWLDAPDGTVWLFKLLRTDRAGNVYGDDWAEVVGAAMASLLGIPTAQVRFAFRGDSRGIASLRMHDTDVEDLVHGNEMLAGVDSGYDKAKRRENPEYSVARVRDSLRGVGLPPGWTGPLDFDGFDVWAGYLVLDAWIANQDRHHENWGTLVNRTDGMRVLAPSFDHGSSLGFNVFPDQAAALVAQPDRLQAWVRRARSGHFAGRPGLAELAREAMAAAGPTAQAYWLEQLRPIHRGSWRSVIDEVPAERMSEASRTFTCQVLETNRRRLLDGDG